MNSREQFETYIKTLELQIVPHDLNRLPDGTYGWNYVEERYQIWNAALSAAKQGVEIDGQFYVLAPAIQDKSGRGRHLLGRYASLTAAKEQQT